MKKAMGMFSAALLAVGSTTAFGAWTIDFTDTAKVTISDGNWTFAVGAKGSYPGFGGAKTSHSGFQITEVVTIPSDDSVATIDFTTFTSDTAAAQAAQGITTPRGIVSSALGESVLKNVAVKTFIAPDLVSLGNTLRRNANIERIEVSPNFCNVSEAMLQFESDTPSLKYFLPTTLPNVSTIGKSAFLGQKKLTGDFVFENVTTINDTAFNNAQSITSLSFLSKVSKMGTQQFVSMSALTNFYAPKCVTTASNMCLYYCPKLRDVTLSPDLSYLGPSVLAGCTALENLSPMTFTNVTTINYGGFSKTSKLRGTLSFPNATTVYGSAFSESAIDEVYMPKAVASGDSVFYHCPNLMKVTMLEGWVNGSIPKNVFSLYTTGCVVHWLGDGVPTSIGAAYVICGSGSTPVTFCLHTKTAQDAWVAQWATRTADQLTEADKKMSTYPGKKATLAYCQPSSPVGNYFWLSKYFETVTATIECPVGVAVAGVTQSGDTIKPNADGTYDVDKADTMAITYETTGDWIFADGTISHTVTNVTPAATISAETCDVEAVIAAARIGEAKYVTLQDAFNAGGNATMISNRTLTASVTLAADKAVKLDLCGCTLTAAGITAFVNAGTLELLNGTVTAGQLVENTGSFKVKAGTYSEDVTPYCADGFHVIAQATVPPTWKVVENVTHNLSLALASLADQHVAAVALTCDGAFTCVTNEGVIVWSVPESLPYTLTYTAQAGYRFGTALTKSVTNETGLTADATVAPTDVPAPELRGVWTWNKDKKTLSDGNWTFNEVTLTTLNGVTGFKIDSATFSQTDNTISNVDFTTCADTAGWPLLAVNAGFKTLPVRTFISPDLVSFSGTFSSNKTIEEVVVSPDIYYMGTCFNECTALRKLTPTKLPKLGFAKKIFYNCQNLEGDFEFDAWTKVSDDNPMTFCKKVTSLKLPNVTRCEKNMEFWQMYALTNFYAPKLVYMNSATLRECTSLQTVVLSDAITYIGPNAFGWCSKLESIYPRTFTNLTALGEGVFTGCSALEGELAFPKMTTIGGVCFNNAVKLESVRAPLAIQTNVKDRTYSNAFNGCTSLTNVVLGGIDGAFTGAFTECSRLEHIWITGAYAAPSTNHSARIFSQGWNGNATTRPPVLHIASTNRDYSAWAALCAETKGNLSVGAKKVVNYADRSFSHAKLIGFLGGQFDFNKDGTIKCYYPHNGDLCWFVKWENPDGFTVIVR